MNELQRQVYLSALGIETYMPRLHLPFAPISTACQLPNAIAYEVDVGLAQPTQLQSMQVLPAAVIKNPQPLNNLLDDLREEKSVVKTDLKISAADILAQLINKTAVLEPFSLSVWRPNDNMMIIDSRNTSLALPTELLMRNLLNAMVPSTQLSFKEEVLRWPMIENSFANRTENDARVELQTWLSVQQEIRPVKHIWLMGKNATSYFMPLDADYSNLLFRDETIVDLHVRALVLPSLIELLRSPLLKSKVFTAISSCQF